MPSSTRHKHNLHRHHFKQSVRRLHEPYTPGAGARLPLVAGRDRELDDFKAASQRPGLKQFLDPVRQCGGNVPGNRRRRSIAG
jgi:hypothetical protein